MFEGREKEIVECEEWLARLPHKKPMLHAMYSSVTDCIVTDPAVMVVPVDDHVVHRGDGVFESFKCVDGNIYNLDDHLGRLERSCKTLGIDLPVPLDEVADISIQTVRAGGHRDALVRLLVSRGLGTMGVNPYACIRPELYIVVYELKRAGVEVMSAGASVALSQVPIKSGLFATVKTCNYLPNVLMKKEAVDLGVDFTVSLDEQGFLGEGATENIGIVTVGRELLMPPLDRVLAGTTARRALDFGKQLATEGRLVSAKYHPISLGMVHAAAEVHIYGTTPNVAPVVTFDGHPVGDGKPGPIAQRLFDMLHQEMIPDSSRLTMVFK